jgi:hypothetical protein
MTRPQIHPVWCALGHLCSADRPGGEHRSHPYPIDTPTARLVVTRVRTTDGQDRLELRVVVDLPADRDVARRHSMTVLARVHYAVTRGSPGGRR